MGIASIRREYSPIVCALRPLLKNLPFKIVSIDGRPGVGKTSLGRYLSYRFNISLIETDLFIRKRNGTINYKRSQILSLISSRKQSERPLIIEGAIVLELLQDIGVQTDFHIHITNSNAPDNDERLQKQLDAYALQFPHGKYPGISIRLEH